MTSNLANGADGTWLTPRDTFLLIALTGPSPAEVHRDLPNILRSAAAYAYPWQPVPAPATQPPVVPGPAAGQEARDAVPRPPSGPKRSPEAGGYWFRRGPLRPRAGSAGL